MSAPSFKMAVTLTGCLAGAITCSIMLLPYLNFARLAGVLLISLALFGSFLITAKGGPALIGTLLTLALTLLTTIGSVSIDIVIILNKGLIWSVSLGIGFVWVAYAFLPDLPAPLFPVSGPEKLQPVAPECNEAIRSAFRSVVILFPLMLLFLFISTSSAYTVIMIKIATMGQQATSRKSRDLARELLASTFWGGAGAIYFYYHDYPAWVDCRLKGIRSECLGQLLGTAGLFHEGDNHEIFSISQGRI